MRLPRDSKEIPKGFKIPQQVPKTIEQRKAKGNPRTLCQKPADPGDTNHNGLGNHLAQSETEGGRKAPARPRTNVKFQLPLIPAARDLDNGTGSMYSPLLVERAGSAHCRNEQTTVAQPVAGPTEGYPSIGKNKKTSNSIIYANACGNPELSLLFKIYFGQSGN